MRGQRGENHRSAISLAGLKGSAETGPVGNSTRLAANAESINADLINTQTFSSNILAPNN